MSGQVTTSHRQGSQFSAGIASVVKPGCETVKGPEDKWAPASQPPHAQLLSPLGCHAGLSRSIILPWGSVFTRFCCIKRMLLASQMIPAMLGGGIVNLSKLAGEDQPLPQSLAQLSAAPGSLCKLLLFPWGWAKAGWKGFAAHPSCSQLLARQGSWLNATCCHPCVKAGTEDRQQWARQGSSALPWGSCAGESSLTLQEQRLGCFLLPQQRNKPTTWTKVQGFSP